MHRTIIELNGKEKMNELKEKEKAANQTQNDFLWHWMAYALNRFETLVYTMVLGFRYHDLYEWL